MPLAHNACHQGVPDFLPIDFIVIGGGIAGLTASISLSRVGHRVTLLEQKWDFDEVRTKILHGSLQRGQQHARRRLSLQEAVA